MLLPLFVTQCLTRVEAFALAMGYTCAAIRFNAAFIGAWYGDDIAVGVGAVGLYGIIGGAVWSLGWCNANSANRKALATVMAWTVALASPLAIAVPGNPMIGWGYLVPGSGWWGVALSLALPMFVIAASVRLKLSRRSTLLGLSIATFTLGLAGFARDVPVAPARAGVAAATTTWGVLKDSDAALKRIEDIGKLADSGRFANATTVVWPESILGRYDTAYFQVLSLEVLRAAAKSGTTHVIGMDVPLPNERYLNSAVAFYPDGQTATATARLPAPVALWKPWRRDRSFVADWSAHNMLALGQGDAAAVIFCYEEYVPALYLLNEWRDHPTVYLTVSNTWAARNEEADQVQRTHSQGMALLFGRPYLRSVNRPSR